MTRHLLPYEDVNRGDIIVFRYPIDIKQTFVKRVMGVAGDRIHLENKKVFLNGHLLDEPYVVHKLDYIDSYRDNFPTDPNTALFPPAQAMLEHNIVNGNVVVPPGYYFAMGDNRDLSLDSRYWGFVPRENIIGKPLVIYWSYDASTEELSNPAVTIQRICSTSRRICCRPRRAGSRDPAAVDPLVSGSVSSQPWPGGIITASFWLEAEVRASGLAAANGTPNRC